MPIHGYPGNVITANPTAPTSSVASGVWTTEQQLLARSAGNWPFTIPTQTIGSSLRFNPADSAYLNRTLGTSNRRTFTFSAWVKRSLLASNQCFFGNINFAGGGSTNQQFFLGFNGSDQLDLLHYNNGTSNGLTSSAVYRDPSAWYHVVCAIDTTQATSTNRLKLYINGSQITTFASSSYPTQNTDTFINANLATAIGTQVGTGIGNSYFVGGYITEVNFIDGQQLTPSSFGRTNTATGVWEPLAYTGTYGTNGFYVNFSDNSNITAATLGKDYSGNGNNWTPNNFSVTAGAGNDSLVDSPTSYGTDTGVGGSVRGNYCTWNPLDRSSTLGLTLSNGNLDAASNTAGYGTVRGTLAVSSGKWYFEVTVTASSGNRQFIGVYGMQDNLSVFPGATANSYGYFGLNGEKYNNSTGASYGASYTTNDVIGVALDLDNGRIWWSKNGTFQASGNPAAGTNAAYTGLSGTFAPAFGDDQDVQSASVVLNAGQRAFAYTAPSGFKALCTQNLPTPTIGATSTTQAGKYFNPILWTATDAASRALTGVGFQPDFLWAKSRNTAGVSHRLYDAVRGATTGSLVTDSTATEDTTAGQLTSFNTDGFTTGTNKDYLNFGSRTYVGWCWKANGAGSSNTAGTITSTVSASTTSGFSIVTYTGTGANATVGHGLGVAPGMVIVKIRSTTGYWTVQHSALGSGYYGYLNFTNSFDTANANLRWNSTNPSSTVFSIGTASDVNTNTATYVAYCFAPVAGYSAFGSYTGNGSADGPFVYLGFRPEFVMVKRTDSANEWLMHDSARSPYNVVNARLSAQSSSAESTSPDALDFTSNGFKLRTTDTGWNASGGTYIYMAFAESPFKYSLAR